MLFIDNIRKYKLSSLLELSSYNSQRLFNSKDSIENIILYEQSQFINGVYKPTRSISLIPWFLADISYYAIKYSNDFATATPSKHDFLKLYYQFLKFDEKLSSSQYEKYENENNLFYILFGSSQKSFWYQEKYRMLNMNARFYDLLCEIPKRNKSVPQFYHKIESKYGIKFINYNIASLALLTISANSVYYKFPYNIDQRLKIIDIDNNLLRKMLLDYVEDYDKIRRSTLESKQLNLTPVVRTIRNELLSTNTFLVAKKAATNLYWETRNLYRKEDGKELNQMLGKSFEIYVDDLLAHYLPSHQYERIPEIKTHKRADILITTKDYKIITEQKFSMLNISLQDTNFDLDKVDNWLENYIQAIKQLEETETQIIHDNKVVVKLILFFDDLFIANSLIKERVIKLYEKQTTEQIDLSNVFMIDINDYEILIYLIANNEDMFNKIISTIVERDKEKDYSKGLEFKQILQEYDIVENEYIKTKKIFGTDNNTF